MRHLNIGVVQMDSHVGSISANLEHAGELVHAATRQGAQLVLTPELMPCGYTLTEEIWNYAEPFDGQTVTWLKRLAKQLNIFLGTSFLEVAGEDFYNTFAFATPEGLIAGRVRKNPPASLEGDELRQSAFQRLEHVDYGLPIGKVYIHSPEDLILYKLIYFGLS